LKAVNFERLNFSLGDKYFFDGDPFESDVGTLDLVLEKKDVLTERCPIFSYRRIPLEESISDKYKELKARYLSYGALQ